MPFLAPIALAGLAFVPLVVAFYLLKLRRDERVVPSTLLWQRLLTDVEANAPWQRLRRSLLLLLQLLLVLILALLAARPFLERPAGFARDLVIVMDASASMGASDVTPSRMTEARARAIDALRDLPAGGHVSVIAAGRTARVVANATSDLGHVRSAIESIVPEPAPGDMADALRLASALAARAGDAEVLVVTDGAITPMPTVRVAAPVRTITVGRQRHNQAIVALAVRTAPSAVTRSVFVSVANLDVEKVDRRIELYGDGRLLEARDIYLDPVARADVSIDDLPRDIGVVEVRLTDEDGKPADQLATDDRAWAVVPSDRLRRILLVGAGDPYYSRRPSATCRTPSWPRRQARRLRRGHEAELFDLVIFDAVLRRPCRRFDRWRSLRRARARWEPSPGLEGSGPELTTQPSSCATSTDDPPSAQAAPCRSLPDWARTAFPDLGRRSILSTAAPGRRPDGRPRIRAAALRPPLQVAFPICQQSGRQARGRGPEPDDRRCPGSLVSLPIRRVPAASASPSRRDDPLDLAPAVTGARQRHLRLDRAAQRHSGSWRLAVASRSRQGSRADRQPPAHDDAKLAQTANPRLVGPRLWSSSPSTCSASRQSTIRAGPPRPWSGFLWGRRRRAAWHSRRRRQRPGRHPAARPRRPVGLPVVIAALPFLSLEWAVSIATSSAAADGPSSPACAAGPANNRPAGDAVKALASVMGVASTDPLGPPPPAHRRGARRPAPHRIANGGLGTFRRRACAPGPRPRCWPPWRWPWPGSRSCSRSISWPPSSWSTSRIRWVKAGPTPEPASTLRDCAHRAPPRRPVPGSSFGKTPSWNASRPRSGISTGIASTPVRGASGIGGALRLARRPLPR